MKLQDAYSEWKEQPRGCPQGSSFGPLLWNHFQNELSLSTQSDRLLIYADDHQVYTTGTTQGDAALKLKSEAGEMWQWYNANLLKANPNRYQVLAIDPKSTNNNPNDRLMFELAGCIVEYSESLKILGVTIDN